MQTAKHAPFLCKFCNQVELIYHVGREEFIETATGKKHRCNSKSTSNQVYVKARRYAEAQPCWFCKSNKEDRAIVYFNTIMPDNRQRNNFQIVCVSCSKKIFYTLASEPDDTDFA